MKWPIDTCIYVLGKAILEKSEWQLFQKTWTFLVGGGSLNQSHLLHVG